jgi:hypothetical protein
MSAVPSYDAVAALVAFYFNPKILEYIESQYPDLDARRAEMLNALHQVGERAQPIGPQEAAKIKAVRDQLAAWERGAPPPTVDQILAAGASAPEPELPPLTPAPVDLNRARSVDVGARVSEQPAKGRREPIEYKTGGYHNVPNLMTDNLLDVIPGPVLKAYIFCTRIADSDASFYVSHGTIARKIGAKDRRHGERVMRRLLDAGLVRQRWRGGPHRANGYTLAGLAAMDFEKARKVLAQPLAPHRDTGPRDRPYTGPTEGMSTGPTDPTTQT